MCAAALPRLTSTAGGPATNVTSVSNSSGIPWSNPSNAEAIGDSSYASVNTYSGTPPVDHTNYLKCQDIDFGATTLSGDDQITGIVVTAYGIESLGGLFIGLTPSTAWHFKMVDYDGVQHGQINGGTDTLFTSYQSYTSRSYPASATNYMWNSGLNQVSWYANDSDPGDYPTDAEIVNDPDFGVAIWLNYYAYAAEIDIDGVNITVYYNEGADPNKPRVAQGRSTKRIMVRS